MKYYLYIDECGDNNLRNFDEQFPNQLLGQGTYWARADYGSYLIRNLAKEIEPEYGSGFGERQLERARQFYREYPIPSAVRSQLNWSQYRLLIQLRATY